MEERAIAGSTAATTDARERRFRDALAGVGGGLLADAVRRDGTGAAARLLARTAWVPDLAAGLAIQAVAAARLDDRAARRFGRRCRELAVALGAGELDP